MEEDYFSKVSQRVHINYIRLYSVDPRNSLLDYLEMPNNKREELLKFHQEGLSGELHFTSVFHSKHFAEDYGYEISEDLSCLCSLYEDYSDSLNERWNYMVYDLLISKCEGGIGVLYLLDSKHPFLLPARFDIEGKFRGLEQGLAGELMELVFKDFRRWQDLEIEPSNAMMFNYSKVLYEAINDIGKQKKQDLISVLNSHRENKGHHD
jgi:hypothetical protein